MDLLEAPVSSLVDGFNYLLIIIDEYTRYLWTRGLKTKYIKNTWSAWKTYITTQYNDRLTVVVKIIRSDNGSEFISNKIQRI